MSSPPLPCGHSPMASYMKSWKKTARNMNIRYFWDAWRNCFYYCAAGEKSTDPRHHNITQDYTIATSKGKWTIFIWLIFHPNLGTKDEKFRILWRIFVAWPKPISTVTHREDNRPVVKAVNVTYENQAAIGYRGNLRGTQVSKNTRTVMLVMQCFRVAYQGI